MSASQACAVTGPDHMTWDEICQRFPEQWVVVADVERAEGELEVRSGSVLGYYKRRKDASPQLQSARKHHEDVDCYWTGKIRGPIPRFTIW